MATVDTIYVHHSGGLGTNHLASTKHLTPEHIEDAHKARWNFRSSLGKYAGYHFIYDPKTREFTQHRAIGEEAAHTRGYNRQIGICIIGNYSRTPIGSPKGSVDPMTKQIENDMAVFLKDLIRDTKRHHIAPNTVVNLSQHRIYPHRHVSDTECYGTFLEDNWARNLLVEKIVPPSADPDVLKERIALLQKLILLLQMLLDLKMKKEPLAGSGRECEGFISNI